MSRRANVVRMSAANLKLKPSPVASVELKCGPADAIRAAALGIDAAGSEF